MRLSLTINANGAAFGDEPGAELARILRLAARELEQGYRENTLRDYNGNTCGDYELEATP